MIRQAHDAVGNHLIGCSRHRDVLGKARRSSMCRSSCDQISTQNGNPSMASNMIGAYGENEKDKRHVF